MHDGVFFLVVSIARDRRGERTLLFTTDDPAGAWSNPVELDAAGIDPSLFFDDDGRAWFTACRDAEQPEHGPAELYLQEFDPRERRLVGSPTVIWRGSARDAWVEAPHLYAHDGRYHLIGAEGGTERHHAVTAAMSDAVTGPYRSDPRNPLLTHRHLGSTHPFQNIGHADLVDTPTGETWAVVLGTRPIDGHHVLGRETFLVPVSWEHGRPVFASGLGQVPAAVHLPTMAEAPDEFVVRDTFSADRAGTEWLSLRGPLGEVVATAAIQGTGLRMSASADLGAPVGIPALIARRQQHHHFDASVTLRLDALGPVAAGLALLQGEHHVVTALIERRSNDDFQVRVTFRVEGETRILAVEPLPRGCEVVRVAVASDGIDYWVEVSPDDTPQAGTTVARLDARLFSTESTGGFLGVVLGPYVEDRGTGGSAVFDRFEYHGRARHDRRTDPSDRPGRAPLESASAARISDEELTYSSAG